MIYLDYAADTPADDEVLKTYIDISKEYIANPNSNHGLGRGAKDCLDQSTTRIADIFGIKNNEIIYTSGATESNNLAIKGIAEKSKSHGRHIITTYLEHSSINGAIAALANQGFEVDYVDINKNGLVDMDHLQELLRDDTILVSICHVDSEIGLIQDIEEIGEFVKAYPNCVFHVDGTQGIGKIPFSNIENIDLLTFSPHKFYGLGSCGVLIKKDKIQLEPLISGGISTTPYRSGTPDLALIASTAKALSQAISEVENRYEYVLQLNKKLKKALKQYSQVSINSTDYSSPYILNISISGMKSEELIQRLDEREIYLSSKSACCAVNSPSRPVYALTKNRKLALSTMRISLSHLTTIEEIEEFLSEFDKCYHKS